MRRYLLTIILFVALLAVGGLVTQNLLGAPSLVRGGYVPTLSTDPSTAQAQGLIFIVALLVIVGATVGLGVFLAISAYRFTLILAANTATASAGERTATTKPSSSNQGLGIPLSNSRSLAIFWIVLVLLIVGLQVLRYWGDPSPFGYLPGTNGLNSLLQIELFKLPGTHLAGLPAWVAGPGDTLMAAHVLVLVALVFVGGVGGLGFVLSRGFDRLDHIVKNTDKLPRTLPDMLIPMVEQRIADLRAPRPKRLPGNPIDGFLIGLNVLLALVIIGIVAFYVVPSYSGVAAVDNSIKATQVALLAPAATQAPSTGTGASPSDALAAQLAKLPKGDANHGKSVTETSGCVACHIQAPVGPGWLATADNATPKGEGIATRAQHRFTDAGYAGAAKSADTYLLESIIAPNAFVVSGFTSGIMPQSFGQQLQPQDLADIIAYLDTLK